MKQVYLGGPMRGQPLYNYQAFEDAAHALRAMGYLVYSPVDFDIDLGYVDVEFTTEPNGRRIFTKVELNDTFDMHKVMRYDIRIITQMDAVVFLPNWQGSSGSKMEDTVREFCGIPRWLINPLPNGTWSLETNLSAAA
jgi:hypothetical protein